MTGGSPGGSSPTVLSAWSNLPPSCAKQSGWLNIPVLRPETSGRSNGRLPRIEPNSVQAYLENHADVVSLPETSIPKELRKEEVFNHLVLQVVYLVFPTHTPPLDDLRVRKAFGLTLDRQKIYELSLTPIAHGGLIPPGMPGPLARYQPAIFNIELGRKLLAEAGYPGGRNFPELSASIHRAFFTYKDELARQWRDNLGIEIEFKLYNPLDIDQSMETTRCWSCLILGWLADYPDPDNFLRHSSIIDHPAHSGLAG